MTLRPASAAFGDGERVPVEHICEGAGLSPPLVWSGAPAGTESLALGPRAGCPEVEKATRAHALAEARLGGTYSRQAAPQRTRP